MKVSVLIPTRERLDYLRHAVESVRRQSTPDWEVVIADNASTEDIAGYDGPHSTTRGIVSSAAASGQLPVTKKLERGDRCRDRRADHHARRRRRP